MTRKNLAKENYRFYLASDMDELYKAYQTCSREKWRAWDYCKDLCHDMGGHGLKVIHKNSFIFTAGFTFPDPETGVLKFMYITPKYNTAVEI